MKRLFPHIKTILLLFTLLFCLLIFGCHPNKNTLKFSDFVCESDTIRIIENGKPSTQINFSIAARRLIDYLHQRADTSNLTIVFDSVKYDYYLDSTFIRQYFISNHDHLDKRHVCFAFENLNNLTIDANGAEFVFHGRMIPISLVNCRNIELKNFSIDAAIPALRQINIIEKKDNSEIIAEIFPPNNYTVSNNKLIFHGENFDITPYVCMAFSENKHLTYKRRDIEFNPQTIEEIKDNILKISNWSQINETSEFERFVLRTYYRPTPAIFVSECLNTTFKDINIHYAEGMGLIAQMSGNITLNNFKVGFKDKSDPRYFTTQADATHFSGCKGTILSENGSYENMADDAINVHGTYLKILEQVNSNTVLAGYMHYQTYGFKWGDVNDTVQFIYSKTMDLIQKNDSTTFTTTIKSIIPYDTSSLNGVKIFKISFNENLPFNLDTENIGIENLTWTPKVIFTNNIIKNNRARGALFSTPKTVICMNNTFDHTHGTAILLCGDCNGWYETGACKNVIIKNNTFINALTTNYQFTNAIISIYPEILDLDNQKTYFHSNIIIEDNLFNTFDCPILYAKSVSNLIFRGNTIIHNDDFLPFHWNNNKFYFERVKNVSIEDNHFDDEMYEDIYIENSEKITITLK